MLTVFLAALVAASFQPDASLMAPLCEAFARPVDRPPSWRLVGKPSAILKRGIG